MPYFIVYILSQNILGEFCVDSLVCPSVSYAYRIGQQCAGAENVYGFIITKNDQFSWSVVNETVYGVDYTIFENNGKVWVKEGRDKIALV
jgi:hypothetical protein